ncbi:MAG: restriction endonuclease [Clostridia bacterium]|nr:restriction endonuclease [Clostridia bacterium]
MRANEFPLYELSHQEFENVCYDLLIADNTYFQLKRLGGLKNTGIIDFEGIREDLDGSIKNVAIEVKHWMHFDTNKYSQLLQSLALHNSSYSFFVLMTSAKLSESQKQKIQRINETIPNINIKILDYYSIFKLLTKYVKVGSQYFIVLKKTY